MNLMTRFDRWEPFEELSVLRNRLNRALTRFGNEIDEEPFLTTSWTPLADVFETKDAVMIRAEVPGVTEKDIAIQLDNNILTVQGERKLEKETDDKEYRRIERAYGKFVRSFTLTPNVETKDITAVFDNGVLEIKIPKKEEAKPKSIKLEVKKRLTTAA